jgi:hypothetical protein
MRVKVKIFPRIDVTQKDSNNCVDASARVCTIPFMGRKKSMPVQETAKPNRVGVPFSLWVPPELMEALRAYVEASRPKTTVTETLRTATEDFLQSKGYWPPKPE